jgi:hypothetical protein
MVSKLQLFSIFSILYVFLDPHKKFHVGKELAKIFFLLFICGIMLYMLTHIFLTLVESKGNSSSDNPYM